MGRGLRTDSGQPASRPGAGTASNKRVMEHERPAEMGSVIVFRAHYSNSMPAFPALATKDHQVHGACGVIVLQGQLSPGIRPRACTGIRYAVGSYDLGRHAATPLGATRLIRQRLSDEGKNTRLGPGFLD